ncbi:MAG: hypothetical protein M3Q11_00695, partial [Pseudomonadota bacterium]|nr:hypothetical protein [Pseudomonadota bacterium]
MLPGLFFEVRLSAKEAKGKRKKGVAPAARLAALTPNTTRPPDQLRLPASAFLPLLLRVFRVLRGQNQYFAF